MILLITAYTIVFWYNVLLSTAILIDNYAKEADKSSQIDLEIRSLFLVKGNNIARRQQKLPLFIITVRQMTFGAR